MGEEAAVTARSFPPVVSENIIVLPSGQRELFSLPVAIEKRQDSTMRMLPRRPIPRSENKEILCPNPPIPQLACPPPLRH